MWSEKRETGRSVPDKAQEELVKSERVLPETSMIIVDSRSIKTTFTGEEKGYDGVKKISGIKLHVGVDVHGLPHALLVTTADVGDRKGLRKWSAIQSFKFLGPKERILSFLPPKPVYFYRVLSGVRAQIG